MNYFNTLLLLTLLSSTLSFAKIESDIFEKSVSNIFIAGESHLEDKKRLEFSENLLYFLNTGGEVLALEMIESNQQELLDNYLISKNHSTKELADYLAKRWGYNTTSYMSLIEHAKKLGLDLMAVDLPVELRPSEIAIFPVPPSISLVRAARESHMAKILCKN